jgi:peptide/nickel transport system substrate-binding protein
METEAFRSGPRAGELFSSEVSRRGLLIGAGGLGLAGLLAACSTSSSGSSSGGSGYQTLNIAISGLDTQSPDPMAAYSEGPLYAPIFQSIGEPLVRRGYDGSQVPALAKSYTISPDNLTWTFTLRSGVKMQDGSPFTSRDVQTSIARVGDKHDAGIFVLAEALFAVITKVDLIDDLHVAITTSSPYESMLDDLPVPIATDYYKRVGDARFSKAPIAAGPFKFTSQVINQSMTLTRFDDFWDPSRKPNFKTLNMVVLAEESTRIAGLLSGSIDAFTALSSVAVKQLQNAPGIRLQSDRDAQTIYIILAATNPNKPTPAKLNSPVHDVRVRQAMLYALDRVNIAKTIVGGGAAPLASFAFPETLGNDPANQPYAYDPDKAKQLLKDAGATGFDFTLVSKNPDQTMPYVQDLSLAIVANWKAVGINARYEPLEAGLQAALQDSWTFDGGFLISTTGLKMYDPSYFANQYFDPKSGNLTVNDPKLFDFTARLKTTFAPAARAALAKEYNDYLYASQPLLGLFRAGSTLAIGPHVKQWTQQAGNGGTGPFWGLRAK